MIECQHCSARTQVYLCPACITWLRKQLLGMPTLIGHLNDTATGNTRLSNEQSRSLGFESRTHSFDDRASTLVGEIESTLGQWATSLATTHGYVVSPPVNWHRLDIPYKHTTADYATFLAARSSDLANDPDVGELCQALDRQAKRGIAMINRRTPPMFCGPCPAMVSGGTEVHRRCVDEAGVNVCGYRDHECATRIMARRGALEVTCPGCGVVHGVEKLVNHLLAGAGDYRCTIPELHRVLRMLGEPVKMDALYRWASPKVGLLQPSGYLRADNKRIGVVRHSPEDKPMYRISDARNQREKQMKPGRRGRPLGSKNKGDKG